MVIDKGKKQSVSEEEKKALVDAILARRENRKIKKKALSKDLLKTIHKAANSDDEELNQLSAMLAFEAVETYYSRRAAGFVEEGKTEFDDLRSELYILISKNLQNYNGKNSLFTFFDPLVNRAFMKARDKGRGLGSNRYFRDLGPYITRAQEEMKKMGLSEPTPTDISDFIRVRRGKLISENTISQWIFAHKKQGQLDEYIDVIKDTNENNDPEASLIKREETKEFYEAIMKTSPRSQLILLAEVEYIEKKGLIPTAKDLLPILLNKINCTSLQDLGVSINHAHNELKYAFNNQKRKLKKLPLNNLKKKEEDLKQLEEEDENIENVLQTEEDIKELFE